MASPTYSGLPESPLRKPTDFDADEDSKPSEKPKLNEILLKHRNVLKLKTVANVVKENARRNQKEGLDPKSTRANTERGADEELEAKFNEDTWRRINSMVKDVN